jgi:hypothetical protein
MSDRNHGKVPEGWMVGFLSERGITWEEGPPTRYDHLGNEYTELLLGGPVPREGPWDSHLRAYAMSEQTAMTHYERILLTFLGPYRHIVWRIEPEIETSEIGMPGSTREIFQVYARLTVYPAKPQATT